MSPQKVPPSVSRDPIPTAATNLPSVCVLCSHNCGIRVDVVDGKMAKVRADESNPISGGYICNKGFSVAHYAHHEQRVEHPMRRRADGTFERIGWDTAIREIAQRLSAIREQHSPRSIGLVGIGGQANHMDAPFGLAWLGGVGTHWWFNAFAQEKTQHALIDKWMFASSPTYMLHPDDHGCEYLLILGSNPRVSNRGHNATETLKAIANDPVRTLVVADPRITETTRGADVHLRVAPGGDVYLMLGMAAFITAERLHDRLFVEQRCADWDTLRGRLLAVDPAEMAARAGIGFDELAEVARDFATARRAGILCDLGIEQAPFSTLNAYLLRLLVTITGNLGRPGGQLFVPSFNPPDPARFEGAPTEKALASGISGIRALGSNAMFSPSLLPEEVMIDHPERIRALVVEGANPLLSYSDTPAWRRAFEQLELVVVIDPAMTETAERADYVLPTPVGYEKWEISAFPRHFPEIHTQLRPPIIAGPPEALPEGEIYARLSAAMNLFGEPPRLLRWLSKWAHRPRVRMAMFAIAAAEAKRRGVGVQESIMFWLYETMGPAFSSPSLVAVWLLCAKNVLMRRKAVVRTLGRTWRFRDPFALTEELFRRALANPQGVEMARLDPDRNLEDTVRWKDGKVRLAPRQMLLEIDRAVTAPARTDSDFPLILSAGLRTPWTANTIHRNPAWRKGKGPHCPLRISREDAEAAGLAEGDLARLETAIGSVELPVSIDKRLRAGHVSVPNGFGVKYVPTNGAPAEVQGVNLNELTAAGDRDPFTGCPHHKHVPCRVSRV